MGHCDLDGSNFVLDAWNALAPVVVNVRLKRRNDGHRENFEYLAALAQESLSMRPDGSLPRNARRMPLPEPWRKRSVRTVPAESITAVALRQRRDVRSLNEMSALPERWAEATCDDRNPQV